MRCTCLVAAILICTFAHAADNQLNRINVAALDHDGQPVTGLQSADFQLLRDGKPQPIAFFRFTGDKPLQAAKPGPGPHESSNRSAASLHATVVLLDLLSDRLMSGAVIGEEITPYLKNLESSQGLYLYILTSSGKLYPLHALPKPGVEVTAAGETPQEPPREPWTRNIGPMFQAAMKDVFGFRAVDDRDVKVRFDQTMSTLGDLATQMRLLPGRKNLVWVTHGLPIVGASISEQGRVDFTNPLRRACEALEREQIVVYPVGESVNGAGAPMATESQQTLEEVSSLTGGRKYGSGEGADAIRQAMLDSRANYQIGYYAAEEKPDGKHHKLRVVCARKEVRLQTEQGSYAMLAVNRPADVEHSTFQNAISSPFDATEIGIRGSIAADPATGQNLRLEIRIDPADLLLHQAQDRRTGKVSLLFAAYEAAGLGGTGAPIPIDISLTPVQYEAALHDGIEFHQPIRIGESIRKVRAIVVDAELGAVGSVTIPIQPH